MRATAVLVALAAVLVWSGCGGSSEKTTAGAPPEEPAQTTAPERQPEPEPTPDRPPAPTLEGVTLQGEPIALADYRGRPVLVNVWSSW